MDEAKVVVTLDLLGRPSKVEVNGFELPNLQEADVRSLYDTRLAVRTVKVTLLATEVVEKRTTA